MFHLFSLFFLIGLCIDLGIVLVVVILCSGTALILTPILVLVSSQVGLHFARMKKYFFYMANSIFIFIYLEHF